MFLSDQLLVVRAGVLLGCQRAPPELTSGVLVNLEAIWQILLSADAHLGESISFPPLRTY